MIFPDGRQQRSLSEDGIAGQQFQAWIHREKLFKMIFQATGLVGFIAVNGPAGEMEFELLSKQIEHEQRITVFVFHLPGGFAIDSGGEGCRCQDGVKKFGENGLQIGERKFSQDPGKGDGMWHAFFEWQKLFEFWEVYVRPSFDFGEGGDVGEKSEKNNGENGLKVMRNALF